MDNGPFISALQVEELVLSTYAGTSETANSCLRLHEHCWFVVREKDSMRLQNSLLTLMVVYAKRILSPYSNIANSEEALESSKAFLKERTVLTSKRRVYICTVPPGFVPVQIFFGHVMHCRGAVGRNVTISEKCRYISLLQ